MRFDLAYGDTTQPLEIPDRNLLGRLEPPDTAPFHDTDAALRQAAESCAAFVADSQRVLVLVNDYTRPTPNAPVLAALRPVLSMRDFRALVCSGTHRPPNDAEYEQVFGTAVWTNHRDRVRCHDANDSSRLFFAGKTSFGTDVWLNRELLWADKVITINSIEPHYFAGFTGGRKGFLPGIAGRDTISHNHNMVTHPKSQPFGLAGNPVHEDMAEAAKMVARPVFSIQLVQDRRHKLLAVHSGDLFRSFEAACADARKVFAVPVKQRADIIISVLRPPYDINFYQSQRAVEFARPALKSPAVQITLSACRDGVGNDGFIQCFRGCKTPADVLKATEPGRPQRAGAASDAESDLGAESSYPAPHSSFGWHKSARLAQIMANADLYTVMGVDDAVIRSVFMTPYKTAQQALDAAFNKLGPAASVLLIPDAGSVVPVLD